MTVYDILKKWMKDNGYDGLCNHDSECGCSLDDFFCCGEVCSECEPAYKGKPIPGDGFDGADFVMYTDKEMAKKSLEGAGEDS